MPVRKSPTTSDRSVPKRLSALEQLARQHGKDVREVKQAVATLERDVKKFREEHRRDVEAIREEMRHHMEMLKASDSLILKEMREGFTEIRQNFSTVFDHLDGMSKQLETLSQEYVMLKMQV